MGSQTLACLIRLTLHFIATRLPDPPLSTRKATEHRRTYYRKRSAVIPHTHNRHICQLTATFSGTGPLSIILLIKPRIIYPLTAWRTSPTTWLPRSDLKREK